MIRLAIIDHDKHELWVEDVSEKEIERCGGEQEYIEDTYSELGNYSWDYVKDAVYVNPEGDLIEIDFQTEM